MPLTLVDVPKLVEEILKDELGDWHRAGTDPELSMIVQCLMDAATRRKPRPEGEARDATRYRRLASFALPRYTVKHVTGDSASTYKEHELVILFQSWDAVGEALDALAPQPGLPK